MISNKPKRVAYTIGICRVPPTYFAIQHAEAMKDVEAKLFGLVTEKTDPTITTPFTSAVPNPGNTLSFAARQKLEPLFLKRMSRQIAAFTPDLIHQHFGTWTLPAITAAQRTKAPLLATFHGADVFARLAKPRTLMQRWHHYNMDAIGSHATVLLAVSEFLADKARHAGIARNKLHVHYQGIDTDFFTPPPSKPAADIPTILFVSGLSEAKGINDTIAASIAANKHLPHHLRIVGDGPLKDHVLQAMAEYPHITYVGPLNRADVREELRGADLFVMTAKKHLGREEAAGLVILEAQACGLPVVVNKSGGTPEMFIDGTTGLGAEPGNIADLSQKLLAVLDMGHDARTDMGGRGRDFVVRQRSLTSSAAELRTIYSSLL